MWRFVALFVLFSILLGVDVRADEDSLSSYLGNNVDLMYVNPNIGLMYEYNGYTCYNFVHSKQGINYNYFFDNALTISNIRDDFVVNDDGSIPVTYYFIMPQALSKNALYDISIRLIIPNDINYNVKSISSYTSGWGVLNKYYNLSVSDAYESSVDKTYLSINLNDFYSDNGSISIIYLTIDFMIPDNMTVLQTGFNAISVAAVSEGGLINSIIQVVKNIFSAITNLPANIANSIKGFFDNVVSAVNKVFTALSELPGKLWNVFETGLIALTVPTEEQVSEFNDKMNNLLKDRFGALYEVGDLCVQHIEAFQSYYEVGTIVFPAVTVDLAGSPFTFGGWTVDICPDGFEFLFDALKLAINMVCTLAVISSLKNRFDRLLGVR